MTEVKSTPKQSWGYPYVTNGGIAYVYNIYNPTNIKRHPYHIVKATMAPILTAVPLGFFVVHYFGVYNGIMGIKVPLIAFIGGLFLWGLSINYDSIIDQQHTFEVRRGLVIGMLLFIASEVMFFFSFFWSYFFISLAPTVAIGCVWPPYGLHVYNHLGLPLLNTVLLLLSGAILTDGYTILTERKIAHEKYHNLYENMMFQFNIADSLYENYKNEIDKGVVNFYTGSVTENGVPKMFLESLKSQYEMNTSTFEQEMDKVKLIKWQLHLSVEQLKYEESLEQSNKVTIGLNHIAWVASHQFIMLFLELRNKLILNRLKLTLACAGLFLYCQMIEYVSAPFSLNDGIYGSLFYLLTGFHGFHVFIGSILIAIVTVRFIKGNFGLLHVGTFFEIFKNRSTGFACTLFYWHFVDIVWLFLYIVIYWWSSQI